MKKQINWTFVVVLIFFALFINFIYHLLKAIFRRKPKPTGDDQKAPVPPITEKEEPCHDEASIVVKFPLAVHLGGEKNEECEETFAEEVNEIIENNQESI